MVEAHENHQSMIPLVRELRFVALLTSGVLLASLAGILIVIAFLNRELGVGFAGAIATIHQLNGGLTLAVTMAILLQVAVSAMVVYFAALRYSHKISGPMYRVRLVLNQYLSGSPVDRITFRSGDFMVPVADQLSHLLCRQRRDDEVMAEAVALLSGELPEDPNDQERLERLRELARQLECPDE